MLLIVAEVLGFIVVVVARNLLVRCSYTWTVYSLLIRGWL